MASNYQNTSCECLKEVARLEENVSTMMKQNSSNLNKMSDMSSSLERLVSFKTWPDHVLTSAVTLVDCGFYHTGFKDEVTCCECGVRLIDWKDDDSPYERQIAESPHCQFMASSSRLLQHKHCVSNGNKKRAENHEEKSLLETYTVKKSDHHPVTVKTNMDVFHAFNNQNSTVQKSNWYTQRNEQLSKHVDYLVEANRYASFIGRWPVDALLNPTEMVEAGLYYVGPNDRVQCAWCRGRMYNWEADDSPMNEHTKHFPKCPFVIRKTQEKLSSPTKTLVVPKREIHITKSNTIQGIPAVHILREMGYALDIIKMGIAEMKSNGSIPSNGKISVEKLLDNIFEIESSKAFSVATDAVDAVTTKDNTNKSLALDNESQSQSQTHVEDKLRKLRDENQSLKGKTLCKICLDNEVDMLLLPCRHLVCCSRCGDAVTQCPMCRTVIIGTVKTFLA